MHELYQLKEKLLDEMKKYSSKDMSAGTLEVVDKLAHATKNLCKVIEDMEYSERGGSYGSYGGGSSREGSYGRGGSYARGGSYDYARGGDMSMDGGSYARGRSAKRDSMGRYSRTGEIAAELRGLMDDVRDPNTRSEFERLIEKVERM